MLLLLVFAAKSSSNLRKIESIEVAGEEQQIECNWDSAMFLPKGSRQFSELWRNLMAASASASAPAPAPTVQDSSLLWRFLRAFYQTSINRYRLKSNCHCFWFVHWPFWTFLDDIFGLCSTQFSSAKVSRATAFNYKSFCFSKKQPKIPQNKEKPIKSETNRWKAIKRRKLLSITVQHIC